MDTITRIESAGEEKYTVHLPGQSEVLIVRADRASIEPGGVLAFYTKSFYGDMRLTQAFSADQWHKITKIAE